MKNTIISLFSGAMGLDQGLENAGFDTRFALEINKHAVETIKINKPKLPIITEPIQHVSLEYIIKKAKIKKPTMVTGGPCCQSFSTAGKRGSITDERGTLFKHFCRIVDGLQPRFFVMENVKGMLSAAVIHRPLAERGAAFPPLSPEEELGSAFKVILSELSKLNYYIKFGLVNSADYGTAQKRHRIIIIGSRDGENIKIPQGKYKNKNRTLADSIKNVISNEWVEFPEKIKNYLKLLNEGENWTDLPEELISDAMGGAYNSWGGRKGFYRRLAWEEPAPSLTTSPIGKATMLCHPDELRPLSIEEYTKLQDFPENYVFVGTTVEKYRMIGNAVPLKIGEAIGKMLKITMAENKKNKDKCGKIISDDKELLDKLQNRKKTMLNPAHMRLVSNKKKTQDWLNKRRGCLLKNVDLSFNFSKCYE